MMTKFKFTSIIATLLVMCGSSVSFADTVNTSYLAEARVLEATPRYVTALEQRPVERCKEVAVKAQDSDTPEILGAVLGGAIGQKIDDGGDGGTIIGALLGASIASDMEDRKKRANSGGTKTVCETVYSEVEVRRNDGYNVTYELNGRRFISSMSRVPGDIITVRVHVLPAE